VVRKSKIKKYGRKIEKLRKEIHKAFVGQEKTVELIIKSLLCNSHSLLESVPGLGKTLLVRIVSLATGLTFSRVQFTPDLLPSDIIGSEVYDERLGTFGIMKGPVFTNILLADEINRAPPKVQSALLQAMEEREVTIGTETFKLPSPFFVFATQNPLEQEGVFPLSIAQNDRFIFKVYVEYPKKEEEFEIIERNIEKVSLADFGIEKAMELKDLLEMQKIVKEIRISEDLKEYIMTIIHATRNPAAYGLNELAEYIKFGASPRAVIFLPLAARATAFMKGRDYVKPEDIKEIIPSVLGHRLVLTYKAEAEGIKPLQIVEKIIERIPIT
jgi:MoxR-like ATPase